MRIATLYLSGPDLWLPEGRDLIARKRRLCEGAGFVPVTARDGERREVEPSEAMARQADAVIANLTAWRGPGCDAASAFEAGFASALAKPVFAYLNVSDEEDGDYRGRVEAMIGAAPDEAGVWRDVEGAEIEDFGLPETLLLWAEARRFFVIVTPDPLSDLTGLELCLDALTLYAD